MKVKTLIEYLTYHVPNEVIEELCAISELSSRCNTLDEILKELSETKLNYVKYGFGGSHIWVKNVNDDERLLLIS